MNCMLGSDLGEWDWWQIPVTCGYSVLSLFLFLLSLKAEMVVGMVGSGGRGYNSGCGLHCVWEY